MVGLEGRRVCLLCTFFFLTSFLTRGNCDLFPLDQIVLVDFNPGLTCASVILVVIVF